MGEEKKMMVAAFIDFLKMEIKSGQLGEEAAEGLEGMESYPKNYFILVRIKSCNRCVVYLLGFFRYLVSQMTCILLLYTF